MASPSSPGMRMSVTTMRAGWSRKASSPAGPLAVRIYRASAEPNQPAIVYFHGGGFVIGDLETHDGHCRRLAAGSGCRVMAVDYGLAPEHPFPEGHDDALAATKWAFDHAAELGADPKRIAVGGDSATNPLEVTVGYTPRYAWLR